MKLDPDCIRDVMLMLEESLSLGIGPKGYYFKSMHPSDIIQKAGGNKYRPIDVAYSILQLSESGYIVCSEPKPKHNLQGYFKPGEVLYITPKGHEFIASVHNKDTWKKKISPILDAIGGVSLSIIESVAKGVANAAIDRMVLNLPKDTP